MNTNARSGTGWRAAAALAAALLASAAWAGRVGGAADLAYESVNSGGASFASGGVYKVGGTLGQGGLALIASGGSNVVQGGFWKAEDACALYLAAVTNIRLGATGLDLSFPVVWSNTYTVAALTASNGLAQGTHAWTTVIATVVGQGGFGSSTTVTDGAAAPAGQTRFYLLRCDAP